jgi:hypothetical protein
VGQSVVTLYGAINCCRDCPHNCPCQLPKRNLQSQQQPIRSIQEVIETRGFARKNEDGRNADRRLANHRLQPLGHLTAARNLSIRQPLSYGGTAVPRIVPEIVPASLSEAARVAQARPRSADPKAGGSFRQQPFRQLLGARRFTRMSRRPNFLVSRRFEDAERSDLACETGRAWTPVY